MQPPLTAFVCRRRRCQSLSLGRNPIRIFSQHRAAPRSIDNINKRCSVTRALTDELGSKKTKKKKLFPVTAQPPRLQKVHTAGRLISSRIAILHPLHLHRALTAFNLAMAAPSEFDVLLFDIGMMRPFPALPLTVSASRSRKAIVFFSSF
jgi:hypothetical protein